MIIKTCTFLSYALWLYMRCVAFTNWLWNSVKKMFLTYHIFCCFRLLCEYSVFSKKKPHLNMLVYTHTHTHTHTHARTHKQARTHTHTHIHAHTHTHTHVHAHAHARTHACTHTRIHAYKHTRIHAYTHTRIHTYTHTHIHTYTHTQHTRIHAYTHTHIHTSTQARIHAHTNLYRQCTWPWPLLYPPALGCAPAAATSCCCQSLWQWTPPVRWAGSLCSYASRSFAGLHFLRCVKPTRARTCLSRCTLETTH